MDIQEILNDALHLPNISHTVEVSNSQLSERAIEHILKGENSND